MTESLLIKITTLLNNIGSDEARKIEVLIDGALDYVKGYCRTENIPQELESTIIKMVIFDYQKLEREGLTSKKEGELSESYVASYPVDILNQLNQKRKILI